MTDKFATYTPGLTGPADNAFAVTPSDSENLEFVARAVYVGTDGNVAVITSGGDEVTFQNLNQGSILPVRVSRVLATGTTATGLVAIY